MERKIGEIFEYNGEWYQCVNTGFSCADCDTKGDCSSTYIGACSSRLRKDGKQVRFKKLEKVGEPITVKDRTFQKLTYDNTSCKECVFNIPNKACYKNDYIDGPCTDMEFWVEIKQNKKDMEEKNNGNTPLNMLTDKYVNGNINYDEFEKEVKALYSCKEESKSELKPFDLEAAKAGKPVCTRDGRKARIICFNAKDNLPIIALITNARGDESLARYKSNGRFINLNESDNDLMILTEKKEGWANVYETGNGYTVGNLYPSKEEAEKYTDEACRGTVKVNWEE